MNEKRNLPTVNPYNNTYIFVINRYYIGIIIQINIEHD